jgi:hypothetical protein
VILTLDTRNARGHLLAFSFWSHAVAEIMMAQIAGWRGLFRTYREKLDQNLWPVAAENFIPFCALTDSRICHILRRMQREMLTEDPAYEALSKIANERGLRWHDTHSIEELVLDPWIRASVCINPMGIEVNLINTHSLSYSNGPKLYLRYEEIEELRRQAALNQGLEDESLKVSNEENVRNLEL